MSKIEVEQITIKIGKKQLALSQEQANELLEVLAKLLGKPQTVEKIIPYWRWWYVTSPSYPQYPNITWSNDTTGTAKAQYTITMNSNSN